LELGYPSGLRRVGGGNARLRGCNRAVLIAPRAFARRDVPLPTASIRSVICWEILNRTKIPGPGAVDSMWGCVRQGLEMKATVSVLYMKDGPDGTTWQFGLREYPMIGPKCGKCTCRGDRRHDKRPLLGVSLLSLSSPLCPSRVAGKQIKYAPAAQNTQITNGIFCPPPRRARNKYSAPHPDMPPNFRRAARRQNGYPAYKNTREKYPVSSK
jgi:hypothetical protein